jgi:hypothetical protein
MTLIDLPKDFHASFEVVEQSGFVGNNTWILRDINSDQHYRLTPQTVKGWRIPTRRESIGPSIIVLIDGKSMVSLHLPTGELYRTKPFPIALYLRK